MSFRRSERARIALQEALTSRQLRRAARRLVLATVHGESVSTWTPGPGWRRAEPEESRGAAPRTEDPSSLESWRRMVNSSIAADSGQKVIATRALASPGFPAGESGAKVPGLPVCGVALVFWGRNAPREPGWVVSVTRSAVEGEFGAREVQRLGALHAELERAWWRVRRLEEEAAGRCCLERIVRDFPLGIAILNWDLIPLYHNRCAADCAARWRIGDAARWTKEGDKVLELPAEILQQCMRLREHKGARRSPAGRVARLEALRVESMGTAGLAATVRLCETVLEGLARPVFQIVFTESTGPSLPGDAGAYRLAQFAGLSRREREVVQLVLRGMSNVEIATALGRSVGTVKTTLHSVFGKLGVRSRAQLLARAR